MKTNNINTKGTKYALKTSVTIVAVTLALITAGIVIVNMMSMQTAYAQCPSHCTCTPNGKGIACSGGGGSVYGAIIVVGP